MPRPIFCCLGLLTFFLAGFSVHAVDYETEIRPILEDRCLDCHGPDKQKSKLRVDQRAALLRGGDSGLPAIVPGDPIKSHLLELVKGTDPDEIMPPRKGGGDPLTSQQIARLEAWIAGGAVWPGQMDASAKETTDHWSFQPLKRTKVPDLTKNPIDAFLLASLSGAGVQPNPPADPRSLIRRVSVVLTGLPPEPQRVVDFEAAFASDPEGAYSALVDELLDSEHFGERWAQHWLDVIRWAESNGSESNLYRKNAWLYRDYVVRSFNEDKPYDEFIREQLAGDSMEVGEAMGFLVSGPHVPAVTVGAEATAIRQARADRMDEIVQTVGASLMGLTMGCARCHNHKFDPISITDYYSLTAVFQDIEFGSRFAELADTNPRRRRAAELMERIDGQRNILRAGGPWEEDWGNFRELHFNPVNARALRVSFLTSSVKVDEIEIFGPADPNMNLALASRGTVAKGPDHMISNNRATIENVNDGQYVVPQWSFLAWPAIEKDGEKPWLELTFDRAQRMDRLRISSNRAYDYETDYVKGIGARLAFGDYRVEVLDSTGNWREVAATKKIKAAGKRSPERRKALAELKRLSGLMVKEGPLPGFVGRFVTPVKTHVLHRGSPENPRDEVSPAAPAILDGDCGASSTSSGPDRRAKFANWMTAPTNPLTFRVMVNRVWHHLFGAGIVPTTSDFGVAGALPSHPELLDWLALEFVQPTFSGGESMSVKSLIRLLVMTDAFRRSSQPSRQGIDKDAGSALLWRFPPRRMEAEVIRDSILQASGKLDRTMGGPSYRIHNRKKMFAQWEVTDNHGPATWRRMIYQERMRRVDDQIFSAFDFPDCGQVRAKRPISTTPLQALNLMNSPFVVRQASLVAERAVRESPKGDVEAAVSRCFELLLTRQPDADELAVCVDIARHQGLHLVCRGLINLNEFVFLP